MTLKRKTFSAIRWTAVTALFRAILQIGQVAVLARLLAPEDYGLMAMVTVVIGFAALFSDMGMNSAYVQRQGVTPEQRSSLFWLNVIVSAGITFLVIAVSPLLAAYFGDARLTPLMMLSALTYVLAALGQQVMMSAEKDLNFRPVAIIEVSAAVAGFGIAVMAAISGWGVYSLIVGIIVSTSTTTALAWLFLARGWRPLWRFKLDDVRSFLGFGSALVANKIVNQVNSSIDIFFGGRMLGATQLGIYSVPRNLALQVQNIVNPIITRVGFPLIAQAQSDVNRVRNIYLQTMNMTSSTNAPMYLGVAFFSQEIVTILLGAGWEQSGDLLRILALWGGLRSTGNPVGSLLLGMGRADLSLKWNLGLMVLIPPVVWYGAQAGAVGMAWTMFGLMGLLFVPGWYILVRPLCHAGLGEYFVSAFKPFLIAGLAITPAYLLAMQLDGAMPRLVVGVLLSAPLYLALSLKGNREWVDAMKELVWQHR